jgi:hypothetical protein
MMLTNPGKPGGQDAYLLLQSVIVWPEADLDAVVALACIHLLSTLPPLSFPPSPFPPLLSPPLLSPPLLSPLSFPPLSFPPSPFPFFISTYNTISFSFKNSYSRFSLLSVWFYPVLNILPSRLDRFSKHRPS